MSDNPPIEYAFPDIRPWEKGDAPYIHVKESGKPGPTVMVASLTHGNEVSGAIVVNELLSRGLKPRQVLTVLALAGGQLVTKEQLAERLWGDTPPASWLATVESYVCVLRRALDPRGGRRTVIATGRGGYTLDLDVVDVDVHTGLDAARRVLRSDDADEADDTKQAAEACDDERGETAESRKAFGEKYGKNANDRNAFGKCVSQNADDDD